MVVHGDHQAAAAVDLTDLHQVGALRVDFHDHVRGLHLEAAHAGDVGGQKGILLPYGLFKFPVEGSKLLFRRAASLQKPPDIRAG